MSKDAMFFGELLVFNKVVDEDQLQQAIELQQSQCKGMLLGDILTSRLDASRDLLETVFLQNILLPKANEIFFAMAEETLRKELKDCQKVKWAMLTPRQCTRLCLDTQNMLWKDGCLELAPRTLTDTLDVSGTLSVACEQGPQLEMPISFVYDIRKKALVDESRILDELCKALFRKLTRNL